MKLRVLSPLHIGNGNTLTPVDVYPDGNLLRVLDLEKLFVDLQKLGVELGEILSLLKNPPGDSFVWKGYIEEFHLDPKKYTRYTLPIIGEPGKESMSIREFIKSNEKPYIPGSSLKGAIRTAVFYKVLKECGDAGTAMNLVSGFSQNLARNIGYSESLIDYYIGYLDRETTRNRKFDRKRADDMLEAIVFGMEPNGRSGVRYEPKKDPLRALIVRDSPPVGKKHLALYRVDVIGNPGPIPVWVEALEPGTVTDAEIRFDRELLRINAGHFNGLLWECLEDKGKPWEAFEDFVWEAVDEFYNALINHELHNISKFGKYGSSVRSFYDGLRANNGHLLRLGWGSGWIGTTIGILLVEKGWKWEQVRKKLGLGRNPSGRGLSREFPKTRRLADGMPMGWVVVG